MHASASAMQAQHDAAQRGVSELRAELHAEREKLREELHVRQPMPSPSDPAPDHAWCSFCVPALQMAAQERQQAESEARAAQSRYAETVHGAAEAAREAVRRSAAADVTNMKAAAAEELSRERAAFQEEIAATQKQLMSERSTLNVGPAPARPHAVLSPIRDIEPPSSATYVRCSQAERQVLEKETEAARNALQAERAQLYVTSVRACHNRTARMSALAHRLIASPHCICCQPTLAAFDALQDSVKRSAAAAREEADAAMLAVQRKQEEVQRERAVSGATSLLAVSRA